MLRHAKEYEFVTLVASRLLVTDKYRICVTDQRDRKHRREPCVAGIGARN